MYDRVLIGFDLETTGVSVANDRPVQASLVMRSDGQDHVLMNTRVNPGQPIAPGASAVHGIHDRDVFNAPHYAVVAWQFAATVQAYTFKIPTYLVTYNGSNFDVPMLNNCLGRDAITLPHVDVLRLARHAFPDVWGSVSQGGRTLGELFEIFLGKPMEKAHDAAADVIATLDLLEVMLTSSGRSIEEVALTQSKPMVYIKMPIGKYRGMPIEQVPLSWAHYMGQKQDIDQDLRATVNFMLQG